FEQFGKRGFFATLGAPNQVFLDGSLRSGCVFFRGLSTHHSVCTGLSKAAATILLSRWWWGWHSKSSDSIRPPLEELSHKRLGVQKSHPSVPQAHQERDAFAINERNIVQIDNHVLASTQSAFA